MAQDPAPHTREAVIQHTNRRGSLWVPSLRCIAACLTCLAFPGVVLAQDVQEREAARPLSLGVQAGINVADLAGSDNDFAPHDRFGFIGGGFLKWSSSERFSLQLDVLYVQKGGEENTDKTPEDPEDQFYVDYLEIPLLFKLALATTGLRPEIYAGPSVAFELSCTYDAFPDGQSAPVDCAQIGIETRSVDVGVAFGADLEIPLGSGHLVIDGRGIVGLASIDASDEDLDIRNRILALMVGYRFPL